MQEESDPTSLVLFRSDISTEKGRLALAATVGHAAGNTSCARHGAPKLTAMAGLWANFVYASVTHTRDGAVCRMIPIPRPVDIADGSYLCSATGKAARAFRPGQYTGSMYMTLTNPKWVPTIDDAIFDPCKGACVAEFGMCSLRLLPPSLSPAPEPATPSFLSHWFAEFRTVFQC